MTETITSPHNEKLKLVRRLAERRGRERERLFAAEGEDLLEAGLATGRQPALVLVRADAELAPDPTGEVVAVDGELLDAVSSLGSGTRVISLWALPAGAPDLAGGRCVYLHGVGDPGNVGAIARSAAGLWAARVVLGPGSADPYSPKAVRAAMGATFALPPARGEVSQTPAPRLALAAAGGESLDGAIAAARPRTLCLGAERDGLDAQTLAACARVATIVTHEGTESLNVAASAAIALHRISSAAAGGDTARIGGSGPSDA